MCCVKGKGLVSTESFMFSGERNTRRGLPEEGKSMQLRDRCPRSWRADADDLDDVFCMVKATMACTSLSQEPLLVFPAAMEPASQKFLQEANSSRCPLRSYNIEAERWDELRLIRHALTQDFPHLNRAAAWYEELLRNPQPMPKFENVPELSFLRHQSAWQEDVRGFRLQPRQLPPKPYELQVVFHRNRLQGWDGENGAWSNLFAVCWSWLETLMISERLWFMWQA